MDENMHLCHSYPSKTMKVYEYGLLKHKIQFKKTKISYFELVKIGLILPPLCKKILNPLQALHNLRMLSNTVRNSYHILQKHEQKPYLYWIQPAMILLCSSQNIVAEIK